MIVADISTIPLGAGTSASRYVQAVHEIFKQLGVKFVPGPMSTAIEADSFAEIFQAVEMTNKKLAEMGVKRIVTTVRIDYRLDKEISIDSKLRAGKDR